MTPPAAHGREPTPGGERWMHHSLRTLAEAGNRRGGARQAVVELLAEQTCGVSAIEIEDALRAEGQSVGRASIYRALEQLERLDLVHRLDVKAGVASYERAEPDGEHHHHLVCARCGRVVPFEDRGLERAIERVSRDVSFNVSEHEVVLRGRCARCAKASGGR